MSKHLRSLFAASSGAVVLMLAGCAEDVGPTGATCPPAGTQLTGENFGTSFLDQYCTRCHSSTLSGFFERQGAPSELNLDTLEDVRHAAAEIDAWSGAGPDRENIEMPPSEAMPTTEERHKLSEWLACGAP